MSQSNTADVTAYMQQVGQQARAMPLVHLPLPILVAKTQP